MPYRPMIANKHPRAMGQKGRDCWPEIWHIIGPMLEGVLHRGEATWSENIMLPLERKGFAEECYFTFSVQPDSRRVRRYRRDFFRLDRDDRAGDRRAAVANLARSRGRVERERHG
jgi:hypothetical protein